MTAVKLPGDTEFVQSGIGTVGDDRGLLSIAKSGLLDDKLTNWLPQNPIEWDEPATQDRAQTDKVTSAPWEPSFPAKVNELFLKEIETPVLDLEEAVRSNRYLVALTRKLVDKPLVLPAGPGIGMMLDKFPNLPPYVPPAAGAGVSAATVAYDAFQEWQQKRRAIEHNHLYFYYEMGRRLRRHR